MVLDRSKKQSLTKDHGKLGYYQPLLGIASNPEG
jgi:hypothetical protein